MLEVVSLEVISEGIRTWGAEGRLTHISGHPSAKGRAQDGEKTLARD